MFIFTLTYKKPLSEVEKYLEEHCVYLDLNYKAGNFIVSGRREPRTGGVIICKAETKDEALDIMKADPFYINEIAEYDVIEFIPSKYADGFEQFI
ncbi:GTP cyclohydrolase [Dysgonomonas capnocytophagoides]|uniref:GTP cyclohydrolase n=1 Tax=Dysgonomonas capnocytophagoides TaxID=45254 RepID=A0A4Y8L324_9BACT|nr:YciI family protein [Dysgonomonas capnocytophagoides]TFD96458.1 GTP cyclohydrolase [Dysgonomonas capnocytophagoides]